MFRWQADVEVMVFVNPKRVLFFCADRKRLLYKLKIQGLGLLAVNWFCNYLSNSSQLLFSKGCLSSANGSWHSLGIHRWASSHFSHVNDLPSVCHASSSKAVLRTPHY